MREQLVKAARMHAEGELERAKTNILVYMHQSVGIGEHSDIVEAIQEELDKMAAATAVSYTHLTLPTIYSV